MAATHVHMSLCVIGIHTCAVSLIISHCVAKLKQPSSISLPSEWDGQNTSSFDLHSLPFTHFSHVPLSCHIFPHHQSISLRLYRSPMTGNTSWLSKRRSYALKLSPVRLLFHDSDEIFKLHFCSLLIGCQYTVCKDKKTGRRGGG